MRLLRPDQAEWLENVAPLNATSREYIDAAFEAFEFERVRTGLTAVLPPTHFSAGSRGAIRYSAADSQSLWLITQ
jgi:hypothetical protein